MLEAMLNDVNTKLEEIRTKISSNETMCMIIEDNNLTLKV